MMPAVTCSACGRIVGVYRNGRIRPHYSSAGLGLCSGAYVIPEPLTLPPESGAEGGSVGGLRAIAGELLERVREAGSEAA